MSHRGATPKFVFSTVLFFFQFMQPDCNLFSLALSLLQKNIVHRDLKLGNMVLNKR